MGFGGLVVGVAALIGAVAGDGERITGHWASADVDASGLAEVTEVLDYDFGPNTRRGIFRDVPGLNPAAPITVESATAPTPISIEASGAATRIRIGDPDITIRGRHRYSITYPIAVLFDGDRISWNAVGAEWPVGIADAELHLLAGTELLDPTCDIGAFGAVGGCDVAEVEPGHLLVTVDSLGAMEGVTIGATRGDPLASAPTVDPPAAVPLDDPGSGALLPAGLAAGFATVAAGLVSPFVRRAGREQVWAGGVADAAFGSQYGEADYAVRLADQSELKDMASIEFAPPKGLTAWQGGIIHDEAVSKDHQVAWLLDRAIAGEVGIAGQGKDLTLSRAPVDSPEAAMLDELFDGRRSLELGKYDKQFAVGWTALGTHLEEWHRASGFWDPAGDRRKTTARVIGILLAIVGIAAALVGAILANRSGTSPGALALLIVGAVGAGAGVGLLIRSWELRVRTARGSGLWILIESFRTFIDQSDSRHVEAAAKQGRLLEYTAWAAALGEVDHWARAINDAELPSGTIHPSHLYLAAAAPNLGSALNTASTAPSSSGGGGGGVGGGGGGGGGGSW